VPEADSTARTLPIAAEGSSVATPGAAPAAIRPVTVAAAHTGARTATAAPAPPAPTAPPARPAEPTPAPPASPPARAATSRATSRRVPRSQRVLEVIPGVVTWALILAPIALSWRFPEVVAWFVLTFDFYWFYKAVMLTGSVVVSFTRIRRVTAIDWRERTYALADLPARAADVERRIEAIEGEIARLRRDGNRPTWSRDMMSETALLTLGMI